MSEVLDLAVVDGLEGLFVLLVYCAQYAEAGAAQNSPSTSRSRSRPTACTPSGVLRSGSCVAAPKNW